jgi:hypothetical protein
VPRRKYHEIKYLHSRGFILGNINWPETRTWHPISGIRKETESVRGIGEIMLPLIPIKETYSLRCWVAWEAVPSLNWNRAVPCRYKIFWRDRNVQNVFKCIMKKRPSDLVHYCPRRTDLDDFEAKCLVGEIGLVPRRFKIFWIGTKFRTIFKSPKQKRPRGSVGNCLLYIISDVSAFQASPT